MKFVWLALCASSTMAHGKRLLCFACGLVVLAVVPNVAAADCKALMEEFDLNLKNSDIDAVKRVEQQIVIDALCSARAVEVQKRRGALQILMSEKLKDDPSRREERERLLLDAAKPGVSWVAHYALGELQFSQRRFAEAHSSFMAATEIAADVSTTPKPPTPAIMQELFDRMNFAGLLAAKQSGYSASAGYSSYKCWPQCSFVSPQGARVKLASLVLLIPFETGSAELNLAGRAIGDKLTTYLMETHAQIVLIGHADRHERSKSKLRLSQKRVEALVAYLDAQLRRHAVKLTLKAEWRGAREPLKIENAKGLTPEDIRALNRRIEVRLLSPAPQSDK